MLYTGFWRRFAAFLIDSFAIAVAAIPVAIVSALVLRMTARTDGTSAFAGLLLAVLFIAGPWLYYALMESSRLQGTLGKLAAGIKVTDLEGGRIGFGRATGRYFGKFISQLILYIGYVMAAFTARKQALHDIMAGTVVPFRNPPLAAGGFAEGPQPIAGWAIALIIVGAMVPMAGILTAIAIPAYADYTVRARVSQGLNAATIAQTQVAENIASAGAIADGACAGVATWSAAPSGSNVASLDCDDSTGEVWVQMDATGRGVEFVLIPTLSGAIDVTWRCEVSESRNNKYVPSGCRIEAPDTP